MVKVNRFTFSHESVTCRRSPEVSLTAFDAQPPDLQPVPLMDMDFAVVCPLVQHRMPQIRFLYIGSRLCSALLSGPASRRVLFHPCASLSLHVHHVVKRTFTSKRSNMLGTQTEGQPAHTREAKLGCVFTQTTWDEEGFAIRDADSTTYTGAIETAVE